jgi:hypothetical protein
MSDEESRRSGLHDKIDNLNDPEVIVVDHFVDAVLTDVDYELLDGSWLVVDPWAEAFVTRLRAHHALNPEPLSTTAFESAFNASCEAAGWIAHPADSATNRFFDTVIEMPGLAPYFVSLKATSAKGMSYNTIHISKLTEAAWIQDVRTQAARRARIVELFAEYREQTDSIIILRCFREEDGSSLLYELVEIPTALFESVDQLTVAEAQASTIPIPPGVTPPDARIRIDRSDAKITITGIQIDVCIVHGRWRIPNLAQE